MGTVEYLQGFQRKCVPNANSCSDGPGTQVDCPQNAICVSAGDSNETNICCRPAAAETIPECPNGGIRQPSPSGYKSCSINSLNDCDPGYSCARASNDFSIQLCCSASTSAAEPVCPNQGFLLKERGRPVYCSAEQPHLCPTNYPCESAVGAPGTYVCCSSSTISCPTRYLPFLDPNGNKVSIIESQTTNMTSGPLKALCASVHILFLNFLFNLYPDQEKERNEPD
ncbi:unnamed protein product [Haemonchus placei]|uniref:EB domain-containing protein n=1 Tax=Haemonchus placei TaxID=6290 RepID=A0A0N4XBB0_HAEPC|nr:unnamed protein product [Haemonchus placei]